ncbi:hypothetical protein KH172YL63_32840 [Bacillus sp. KH172YL63]|nr:hypothetical protein KH172YL63_32840 [Bacillus sp. KH172YL63]
MIVAEGARLRRKKAVLVRPHRAQPEEAHRQPRGKRAPAAKINQQSPNSLKFMKIGYTIKVENPKISLFGGDTK